MNCAESRLLLHADADNELDAANSLELEHHVKSCPACAAETDAVHSLKALLRKSPLRFDTPESVCKAVRELTRPRRVDTPPRWFNSLLLWKWGTFGATAFALVTIFVRPAGLPQREQLLNEAVAGHVRSLMAQHLTDVASTDQHTVKPWFNGKLDFAPEVQDFAARGFALVGGRLDYLDGRAVAALIYQRNKHLINVFVWPAMDRGGERSTVENRRGYSVVSRESDRLHYCFVSDLNLKELVQLADLLAP